ncbi:synaptophysin-like protein 1 [Hyla sarda]|uniref:synaptophysin-like protein 1 n=1 Tax=Hyla sarda TaxID=327740 RepID=UPI0024C3D23A|nr:synaptophysin-like protein 1 [Hyla sarda]
MNRLTQKMSGLQLNFSPLKEPLGFIKVLEWFFSIFSFATCGGYSGKTSLFVTCKENNTLNGTIEATFTYPFRLNNALFQEVSGKFCAGKLPGWHLTGDYSSSAEFYVTIAVFAFLYCIGALVLYLGFRHLYQDSKKLPLIDFIITVIFAFMWLVSSSAWAKGLTDIKYVTSPSTTAKLCHQLYLCTPGSESRMGSLNISVAFGFLNLILWAGNAWFVYKETDLRPPQPSNPEDPPPSSM